MDRRKLAVGGGVVIGVVLIATAGYALTIGLSPTSGKPGSTFTITVDCPTAPTVQIFRADPSGPPGTVGDEVGTETSPGVWTYVETADPWNDDVGARCNGQYTDSMFNVINPILYFGPIAPEPGPPTPDSVRPLIEGTDCPAGTEPTVHFTGPAGSTTATAPIDQWGDWSTPIPSIVHQSDLVVTASCGDVTYKPLTIPVRPLATTTTTTTTTTTLPATTATAPAATPVQGPAEFTG